MSNYLPWIEKYRPTNINNIISNELNLLILSNMLKNNSLPHLLFYGTPGTGKTSTILTLANKLYGNNINLMVMKLDASDDRGINSVRDEIKGFAERKNMFCSGVKLIILDEVDSMTFDAQFALRRIIEKYSDTTRFCLICNYDNKIIPAIRSRCANFRFNPIEHNDTIKYISKISKEENLIITDNAIEIISKLSNGDLRKAINFLQSISMKTNIIDSDICYENASLPNNDEINNIYQYLITDIDFKLKYDNLHNLINSKGYTLTNILKEITLKVINDKTINNKLHILSDMADLENKITKSTFVDIYITTLISLFIINL